MFFTKMLVVAGVITAGLWTSPSAAAEPQRIPEPPPPSVHVAGAVIAHPQVRYRVPQRRCSRPPSRRER
jgi:hypothetical protein